MKIKSLGGIIQLTLKKTTSNICYSLILFLISYALDNEGQIPPSAESRDIFGILGIINLLAGICTLLKLLPD